MPGGVVSRLNDLFDITPPEAHSRNVEAAVAPLLAQYRAQNRKQFFMFMGAVTTSFALSAVFILRFFKDEQKPDTAPDYALNFLDLPEEDINVVTEMESFADLSEDDFELLLKSAVEEES